MSSAVVSPVASPAEQLAALSTALDESERQIRAAVRLVGQLAGTGVCEQVEGLPLELFVTLRHRMPQGDARMLCTVAEVLAHMPATGVLFDQGDLSWGQVRRIVSAARRLNVKRRGELDARIQATVAERGGTDAFDPDGLVDAVDDAVAEIRERDQRKPKDPAADNFIAVQQRLDGGIKFHGEADDVVGAGILNALHAAAQRPAGAGEATEPGEPTVRGRQLLEGLATICAEWLGGGSGKPARPLCIFHFDTTRGAGSLELAVRGKTPRLSAAACEILAKDADFRAVLFDGARPLATSAKLHADQVPTATEIAVRARDLGCRFPGSRDPLAFTDTHHIFEDRGDRDHDPDKLVHLSRPKHGIVHKHGWKLVLSPGTGQLTARRRGRAWKSLPRGTQLSKPDDRAPPDMPF